MFGVTAKVWRDENSTLDGNIRDHATLQQLIVLSNLESINAELIKKGISREDRLVLLNKIAKDQMDSLLKNSIQKLEKLK